MKLKNLHTVTKKYIYKYKYIKFLVNTIITKFKLFLAGLDFLNVIIYSNAFECCLLFLNQGRLDSSKPSGGGVGVFLWGIEGGGFVCIVQLLGLAPHLLTLEAKGNGRTISVRQNIFQPDYTSFK